MKIALISADATPPDPGEHPLPHDRAHFVAHLARGLGAAGHRVDVFARRSDLWTLPVRDIAPNVRVISVPAGPPHFVPNEALLPYMNDFAARVVRACAGAQYDVAHATSYLSGIAAIRVKQRCGMPFLMTFPDLGKVCRHHAPARQVPVERERLETLLAAAADRIIAVDPRDRDDLVSLYRAAADRIDLVPPGVEAAAFGPGSKAARVRFGLRETEFVILQFARFVPGEGLDTLIRAVSLLKREHGVRTRLAISGERDDADPALVAEIGRIRTLASRERVADQTTFIGTRPHAALRDAYASADVLVAAPSCATPAASPLEAMASGVPVIGSDRGLVRLAVEDQVTGYLVAPDDPSALAERLARFVRNPELARAYGRAGIRRVRAGFTWHHVATAVACVYAGVLAPHRARLAAAASGR